MVTVRATVMPMVVRPVIAVVPVRRWNHNSAIDRGGCNIVGRRIIDRRRVGNNRGRHADADPDMDRRG